MTKDAKIAALKASRDLGKRTINFCTSAGSFVSLIETIVYTKSGDILISSGFTSAHGFKVVRYSE
jgi:hypothetical protein